MKFTPETYLKKISKIYPLRYPEKTRFAVGLSGGVDSAVAAALLKEMGYEVVGLFMKNWEEEGEGGVCPQEADEKLVIEICRQLQIPYYPLNFTVEYRERVFSHFLQQLERGLTPNPDILCNSEIKFNCFLKQALNLGVDYLATGHYAEIETTAQGEHYLLKGRDEAKDQSYFLYNISPQELSKIHFPLGPLSKGQVRKLARHFDLPNSEKKDSTGICFIGERKFTPFLKKYLQGGSGDMVTPEGKVVGRHHGLPFYTIGQRRGLGLGGPGEPWYVVDKETHLNTLVVVRGENHPALFCKQLTVQGPHWLVQRPAEHLTENMAKIRYRQKDTPCRVELGPKQMVVHFQYPQRAVTLGQSCVLYQGEKCLGGGVITSRGPE